tara:strand:+ start:224 stop:535 length:312 start_codon:yes stop_codon:yes gene_type:complete
MSKFMAKKEKKQKQRHQVKSRWYYIFWGTCTVAVCSGQILVGSGFRRMAESFESVLDSPIHLDFGIPRHRWHDPFDEDGNLYHPTNPPKAVPPAYKEDFKSRI